ncbi:MAG TPA: hypothetical protein ENI86_01355 [Acidimicrobiales bacterium]|nr:hypothetical protein [Acidimicrobiales bacterium]
MPERTAYEIVLRGRPSLRLLRPFRDDFVIDTSVENVTRLVGEISDPAQLHGLLLHVTSVNLEIVSIAPAPTPEGTT